MLTAVAEHRLVGGQTSDPTHGPHDLGAFWSVVHVSGSWCSAGVAVGVGCEPTNALGCVVERNIQRTVESAQEFLEKRFLLFCLRNSRRPGNLRGRQCNGRWRDRRRGNNG